MSQRKKQRKPKKNQRRVARSTRMESLEARQVMSADPLGVPAMGHHAIVEDEIPALSQHSIPSLSHHALLEAEPGGEQLVHHGLGGSLNTGFFEPEPGYDPNADFWLDTAELLSDDLGGQIDQLLNEAHQVTGQDEVVSKYGFDGSGQTVVVIDSGIAWDHYALGGGYGEGYRVVGGWDFTENDADPYDDGPSGAHGTHVAGIIGAANGGNDDGVATGVDLVGLRVFDDAGNGYFSWVEDALDWVHDNKDAFDSPITAVNLSLGTEWNSHSIPGWAMLEEEFAALEADGIFVSVSAGNSFQNYNTPGVSYPAGSDHVIPVMSLDTNGQLSYFSQRAEYAIAAPGRWITSTVPDYAAGDADTITDDWASMSGTSMAAPYVAGASVLVREAMEFVGMTDIDQWDIFNHMMATGEQFYDSATSSWYTELNLEAAIDALMPTDDYGSSFVAAHDLGTIDPASVGPQSLSSTTSGVISTLDDTDYFRFTAGATGTATFTVAQATHNLVVDWAGLGWKSIGAGVYEIDVVGGQSYSFAVGTTDGLGYYEFDFELESSFTAIDWGTLGPQQTQSGVAVSGESWFSVTAGAGGYLTADVVASTGAVTLQWYDAQQNLLAGDDGGGRVDAVVAQGEQFYLRVAGETADVDLRLTNAVSVSGSVVSLTGTAGADSLAFTAGAAEHTVSLNGVEYAFAAGSYDTFDLDGAVGDDDVTIRGTAGDDHFTIREGEATLLGDGVFVDAESFSEIYAHGGGGDDEANLYDSAGDDRFYGYSTYALMRGDGFLSYAAGFERVHAFSHNGGYDEANLYDSAGDDRFYGYSTYAYLHGDGFLNYAGGFDRVHGFALAGGHDEANLYDSPDDDRFYGHSTYAYLQGAGAFNYVSGFDRVHAIATNGGYDVANIYDSSGDDRFFAYSTYSYMSGEGFFNYASGFDRVNGFATAGGYDESNLYDTAGNDRFYGRSDYAYLQGAGYYNFVTGFDRVHAFSFNGGYDEASVYDSAGDDRFYGYSTYSYLHGDNYFNYAAGFDRVYAFARNGGHDEANVYDSAGDDRFYAYSAYAFLHGDGFFNYTTGFDRVHGFAFNGGYDEANLYDSVGDDQFAGHSTHASMQGAGYFNYAAGFNRVHGFAFNGGNDVATLHDSSGDDRFYSRDAASYLYGNGFFNYAAGFDRVDAIAAAGGYDRAYFMDPEDGDAATGTSDYMEYLTDTSLRRGEGFDYVSVEDESSAVDFDVEEIDYAFEIFEV